MVGIADTGPGCEGSRLSDGIVAVRERAMEHSRRHLPHVLVFGGVLAEQAHGSGARPLVAAVAMVEVGTLLAAHGFGASLVVAEVAAVAEGSTLLVAHGRHCSVAQCSTRALFRDSCFEIVYCDVLEVRQEGYS